MELKTSIKDQIETDFLYAVRTIGEDVLINGLQEQVLISSQKPNEDYDGLTISSLSKLSTGDIIEYQQDSYLVISEVPSNRRGVYKALLRHLPYNIAINCACDFVQVPCFFDSKTIGLSDGQVISLPEGTILATIPATVNVKKIKLDNRFISMGGAWKITGIDKTTPGLMVLSCIKDATLPEDIGELAGVGACSITIITEPQELEIDQTLQIEWTGVQDVTFTSSNEEVATVDSNGLVTAVGGGSVTITVSSAHSSDSIILTVAEPLPSTVTIDGLDIVRVGAGASNYTADQEVSWAITNQDDTPTTFAKITSSTNTTCKVEAVTANKTVKLVATLLANPAVKGEKIINTKPLF